MGICSRVGAAGQRNVLTLCTKRHQIWHHKSCTTAIDEVGSLQRSSLIPSGNKPGKSKRKVTREGQIESDDCNGNGFLDQLAELILIGMATADATPTN